MNRKYRHVLPDAKGHFAAYILRHEPFGLLVPLVDRILVEEKNGDEHKDKIIGTVIHETEYRDADIVGSDTKFMGYVDPVWLQAKQMTLMQYEAKLKEWGQIWQTRSTPVVVPAAVEQLFGEPDFDEEDEEPTPPRKRRGR